MNMLQERLQDPNLWKRLSPWAALTVAVLLLAWPSARALQVWHARVAQAQESQPGFTASLGTPAVIASSPHIRLLTYENYVSQAAARAFLEKAELQRTRLMDYLGIPGDDRVVTVVLLAGCDISHSGSNFWLTIETCNNRSLALQSITVMHELTHALMLPRTNEQTGSFFTEGLAVAAGERFSWQVPIFPLDYGVYSFLRAGTLIPLPDLYTGVWSADQYQVALTEKRYSESGSFAQYLTGKYGVDSYLITYQDNGGFEKVYGQSLAHLELGWLNSLRRGNLFQAVLLTLGGVGVLGLASLSILRGWQWIPAALIGWLAFWAWLWLCLYPTLLVPGLLLLAGGLGGLIGRWRRLAGLLGLWLIGAGILVAGLLVPAVQVFH